MQEKGYMIFIIVAPVFSDVMFYISIYRRIVLAVDRRSIGKAPIYGCGYVYGEP